MLTSVRFQCFRGFRDLKVEPLKRINLIAGQNNTGKTAWLEGLCLLLHTQASPVANNLPNLFRALAPNADANTNFWHWLFYNKNTSQRIEIEVSVDNSPACSVVYQNSQQNFAALSPNEQYRGWTNYGNLHSMFRYAVGGRLNANLNVAVFSTNPSNPTQDAIDYNRIVLKRRKKQVEQLLRQIEPRLEAIEPLQTAQQAPMIYADVGLKEMIPVTQLGQGFCRLLDIFSEVLASESQILLIDEIENGIHHSVMPTVWRGLALAAAQADIQIFATTHSWECIVAAHKAFAATPDYDFALHRLERVKDDITAVTYDREALEAAIKAELEVR